MTYDEAMQLPKAEPFGDALPRTTLPAGSWPPAGMPSGGSCVHAIELDLDGNGKPVERPGFSTVSVSARPPASTTAPSTSWKPGAAVVRH